MRLRCGTFCVLVAAILTATAADVQPISVRVRQTAGGPRLFVDGKPIPPRAFYGAGPSIGFIAELREYTFTLPFVAPFDAARAEVRIGFPREAEGHGDGNGCARGPLARGRDEGRRAASAARRLRALSGAAREGADLPVAHSRARRPSAFLLPSLRRGVRRGRQGAALSAALRRHARGDDAPRGRGGRAHCHVWGGERLGGAGEFSEMGCARRGVSPARRGQSGRPAPPARRDERAAVVPRAAP